MVSISAKVLQKSRRELRFLMLLAKLIVRYAHACEIPACVAGSAGSQVLMAARYCGPRKIAPVPGGEKYVLDICFHRATYG